ncbi:NosD domain-containing protein [Mucilaginibacter sp.]|jgi:parallel beta-helix repeat protein|uniref:NosD domain-containing protein n=1 Tax=Mucilaginibacter sp. TaxID=1882438 RepID=UPI003563EA2C
MAIIQTTIAGIRGMSAPLTTDQYYTTDIGQQGFWYFDASDTISTDNTGTILRDTAGDVFKRVNDGVIELSWFGVVGVGNESALIQAAINAAEGKNLYINKGVFYAKNLIGVSNIIISGVGTLKTHSSAVINDTLLTFTNCTNVIIEDIILDGNKGIVPGSPTAGVALLNFFTSTNCKVSATTLQNNGYLAINVHSSPGIIISNNYINNTDCGVIIWTDCDYSVVSSNVVENGTSDGIVVWGAISSGAGVYSRNVSIVNNTINAKTGWGVFLRYGSECSIVGNTITNMGFGVGSEHIAGQPTPTAINSVFTGNTISKCHYGVYGFMQNCTIVSNTLIEIDIPAIFIIGSRSTPSVPAKNNVISGNTISNSSYITAPGSSVTSNIRFENVKDCSVTDNIINHDTNSVAAGIVLLNALTTRNFISNNFMKGVQPTQETILISNSSTGNIIDGGNGTIVDAGTNNIYVNRLPVSTDSVVVSPTNDAKLPLNGDFFKISGSAVTINSINTVTGVYYGRVIHLLFTIPNCIINRLVGNIGIITPTYVSATNSIISFVWNGTIWAEMSRSTYNTEYINNQTAIFQSANYKVLSGTANNYNVDRLAGVEAGVWYKTNNVNRWLASVNNSAETGSNAGSDYQINRYADNGSLIDQPMTINRQSGFVNIKNLNIDTPPTATENLGFLVRDSNGDILLLPFEDFVSVDSSSSFTISKSNLNSSYPTARSGRLISFPYLSTGAIVAIKQDDSVSGDWITMAGNLAV